MLERRGGSGAAVNLVGPLHEVEALATCETWPAVSDRRQIGATAVATSDSLQGVQRYQTPRRCSGTRLASFAGEPRKSGLEQANRITLPAPCCFNNSLGNDFDHYFLWRWVVKCLKGSVKSGVHSLKRL